ncbi:MAG: hypothetical protein GF353_15110 [Candidatus Lokiarchaeota archaeon]|nr:hypothetical protein [Candidatus Lokiarchaeota archaeon]
MSIKLNGYTREILMETAKKGDRPRIASLTNDEIQQLKYEIEESLWKEFNFYAQEYINNALYSLGILK